MSDLAAIGIVVLVAVAWTAVQIGWRRVFADVADVADVASDPDALAERMGCGGGCGCLLPCERQHSGEGLPAPEKVP